MRIPATNCSPSTMRMAVSLPAVLLILDAYPLRRLSPGAGSRWRVLAEKAPYAALAAGSALATLAAAERGIGEDDVEAVLLLNVHHVLVQRVVLEATSPFATSSAREMPL